MQNQPPAKVALVTGSSRGIGKAIAITLGQLGYGVTINYCNNHAAAQEVAQQVADSGGQPLVVQGNISIPQDRKNLVDQTITHFGSLDLLVNNAGIAPAVRSDLMDLTEASYDHVLNTNLKGPFFLTQYTSQQMISQNAGGKSKRKSGGKSGGAFGGTSGGGQIINIGSISAFAASVNRSEYCIAKAGMGMMTQLFASRLAEHNINVYEIRPGIIATDMTGSVKEKYDKLILQDGLTPIARWGQPEDIANAVSAIAQGLLAFSTGQVVNVDGGFHMHRL